MKKMIAIALLFMVFLLSKQLVSAESLTGELDQIAADVKKTVGEVSQQLSGEEADSSTSAGSKETIDEIKKRLEKTVEDTKVKGVTNEARRRSGFIGEVARISEEAVTVSNATSTTIVPLKDVTIVKSAKSVSLEEIVVGNWVTVLGTNDTNAANNTQSFTPKFILVATEALQPTPKVVTLGTIQSSTTKSITVLPRSGGEPTVFVTTSKTNYQDSDGQKATAKQFEDDMNVLVVAYETIPDDEDDSAQKQILTIRSLAPLEK